MLATLPLRLAPPAIGIAAAVLGLPAIAQTPPCGTVLTQSIRLNADMSCSNSGPALIVGADNVHIDLAGHSIDWFGPRSFIVFRNPPAIDSWYHDNTEVIGPGKIGGYGYDVRLIGGRMHAVYGITGYSDLGVFLGGASDSKVVNNRLSYGVRVFDTTGQPSPHIFPVVGPAMGNQIRDNVVGTSLNAGVVALHGCLVSSNTVSGNQIGGILWIYGGANQNLASANRISASSQFTSWAVLLGESYGNEVSDNVIDAGGAVGISIEPQENPECVPAGQPGGNGENNYILSNYVQNGSIGMRVGAIPPPPWTLGTGNVILGNTFLDMTVSGQFFGRKTSGNDGRNNKYSNVPVLVQDLGIQNLWP